ncbi:MAG: 23S rRNA (pseudouridine(1915)-N(3))-methyltransferase RlmH [Bradymonadia bacterium]
MKLSVIAVGKLKMSFTQAGCDEYFTRLRRHFPHRVVEVKEPNRRGGGSVDRWRQQEAKALMAAMPSPGLVVALDEGGHTWDSQGFARWLADRRDEGVPEVAFIIGGPDGLDPSVRKRANKIWSLGRITLPHEMARLVLAEQLYRAGMILAGAPYHR